MGFLQRLFGGRGSSEPPEFRALIEQSMNELRLKTEAHNGTWQLGQADWSVQQETGRIVFKSPDGITATCPAQIIGTFDTEDSTWMWGWDHPSVLPPLQAHAKRLRMYGQEHGISRLTTQTLQSSEEEAWEFAALACKLCGAQGAYRGPAGSAMVFMTFGEVKLSKS